MKTLMRYIRKQALVVTVLVIIVVAAVTTLAFAAADSNQQPTASTPSLTLPLPTPVDLPASADDGNCTSCRLATLMQEFRENAAGKSAEEVAALKQDLYKQIEQEGLGRVIDYNSPDALGAEINIAGKSIKLPADAKIAGIAVTVLVATNDEGTCLGCEAAAEAPLTWIVRGESSIWVGKTGMVVGGNIDPAQIGAFDFLKEAFPEQSEAIDLLPIKVLDKNPQLRIVGDNYATSQGEAE